MAEDLARLIRQEAWAPMAYIGHSAGAAIALRLAELAPPRAVIGLNAALGQFEGVAGWLFPVMAKLLAAAEAAGKAAGLSDIGTVELVAREAGPAIVAYAEQNGYDHIVMGTGDKRGVKRLVLGSVAAEVSGQAPCTVTVAR